MPTSSENPARPPAGVRLCELSEIGDPGTKGFRFREGHWLFAGFVVRAGALLRGYVDICPHASWPLAALDDRYLTRDKTRILCSGHGALFQLDGLCVAGPCVGDRLTDWAVSLRDGAVFTV